MCEQVSGYSELRHSFFNLTLHLFYIDAHSIAIDGTMRLELEDHTNAVAAQRLLIERALNHVNGVLVGLVPLLREVRIVPMPAISRLA